MKKLKLTLACLVLLVLPAAGQSYLLPSTGYEARDIFPAHTDFQAIDIHDTLVSRIVRGYVLSPGRP